MDQAYQLVGKELLLWLQGVAAQNDKYADVVLIQNLHFFTAALRGRRVNALLRIARQASQQCEDAQTRYVNWMVSYEFPSLFALQEKMRGVGQRATQGEMGLYVRRDDVTKALLKLDARSVEASVGTMRKRLEKHFGRAEGAV